MVKVLQCFKFLDRIAKPEYTPGRRKQLQQREKQAVSTSGYLQKGGLYLPEKFKAVQFENLELVVLQDTYTCQKWHSEVHFFKKPRGTYAFDIFRIDSEEIESIDLYLNFTANASLIGFPGREDHKFMTLKKGKALQYLLNGKSDFTLTGRKQRTFNEFEYIFEYPGEAGEVHFVSEVEVEKNKMIPQDFSTVDERKLLK